MTFRFLFFLATACVWMSGASAATIEISFKARVTQNACVGSEFQTCEIYYDELEEGKTYKGSLVLTNLERQGSTLSVEYPPFARVPNLNCSIGGITCKLNAKFSDFARFSYDLAAETGRFVAGSHDSFIQTVRFDGKKGFWSSTDDQALTSNPFSADLFNIKVSTIPLPGSVWLLPMGLVLLRVFRGRKVGNLTTA